MPEHPRNLGVQKGAKPDFCLLEFSYYYKHSGFKKLSTALKSLVLRVGDENFRVEMSCNLDEIFHQPFVMKMLAVTFVAGTFLYMKNK